MTREEAIEVLKHNYPSACFTDLCEAVEIAIQALSAVRPVVRGRWESNGDGFGWVFVCSVCGFIDGHPFNDRMNYCPNCGADMREGDSE